MPFCGANNAGSRFRRHFLVLSLLLSVVGCAVALAAVVLPAWQVLDLPELSAMHEHAIFYDCIRSEVTPLDRIRARDATIRGPSRRCTIKIGRSLLGELALLRMAVEEDDLSARELLKHRFLPQHKAVLFFSVFTLLFTLISVGVGAFCECFVPNAILQLASVGRGVDVTTLLGLFLYLGMGVFTHFYVIHGVRKGRARFLLPFIALYSVLCTFELFMCAALLFKVVEPNATVASASGIIVRHPPFAWLLIGMLFILSVQAIMLCTVLRCRHFLSKRELHLMTLRVAEKSRQDYPSIQIVVTSGATSAGSDELSASRVNNSSSTIIAMPNGRHEVVASFSGSSAAEAPAQQQQQNADVQQGDQPILKGLII
uniref:Organic solute transporter subunit alpha/Transmembrane protein n=1 Tax=Globodera pallida TaxID=36090 RepID=A0A183BRS3_GLOPA